jgi:dephospho-CoA kinase
MILKIGITGSIGSGKTTVAKIFEALGVGVFHADIEARGFYSSPEVIRQVKLIFGNQVFDPDGQVDRKKIAQLVFREPEMLARLNDLIHPLVRERFRNWCEEFAGNTYILYEAAILFESGYYKQLDKVILVTAPAELCISRVMERDGISRENVEIRMKNQWEEELKIGKADFVIINDGLTMVIPQVLEIHSKILNPS